MSEQWTVTHDERSAAYSVYHGSEPIAHLFYARGFPEARDAQRLKAHMIAAAPALLEALEAVQWGEEQAGNCPSCMADQAKGHDPDCRIGSAIASGRAAGGGA